MTGSQTAVMIMVAVAALLLVAAGAMTVLRMSRGPTSLDRVVAADVLVAIVIVGLALDAILNRHTTTLPVMLVLSLLGFAGSVSIARFVADRDSATRWSAEPGQSEKPGQSEPDPSDARQSDPEQRTEGRG